MQNLPGSQLQYTCNQNQFPICIAICSVKKGSVKFQQHVVNYPDSQEVGAARWKARGAGSIPGGGIYFHLEFLLIFRCSQLGEAYTNEIKHNIHPE